MSDIYVLSLPQHISITGFFRMCKMCLKTKSWDRVSVLQRLVLYNPVKKNIQMYVQSLIEKYFSQSYSQDLPTSYKSSNGLKHNQTAFQGNVSVNERLRGQHGVGSAQDPIRAAPHAVSAGCVPCTSCPAPCSHMETAGSLFIVVSSAKSIC